MTERLYYDDAYLWQFDATVTSVRNGTRPGEWEITLDRSAFYPTSGGQPFDTGTLTFGKVKAKVTDVEVAADGDVIHTVDKEIPAGTAVRGSGLIVSSFHDHRLPDDGPFLRPGCLASGSGHGLTCSGISP